MKAIVCEMCTSNDVVKQDGYYVCQSCGTKYSIEEARKLLVEVAGKVDISGSSVKVDYSDFVLRSLENARRAFQKEDWEEAEKYYNLAEQNEPSNIEAIFYSAYAKAMSTLVSDDVYRRESVFNSFAKSISIIDDNFNVEKEKDLRPLVEKMYNDIVKMSGSSFVYTMKKNGYGVVTSDNSAMTYSMFFQMQSGFVESVENIAEKLKGRDDEAASWYYLLAKKTVLLLDPSKHNALINTGKTRAGEIEKIADALADFDQENAVSCYKEALDYLLEGAKKSSGSDEKWFVESYARISDSLKKLDPSFDSEVGKNEVTRAIDTSSSKRAGKTALIILLFLIAIVGIALYIANTLD